MVEKTLDARGLRCPLPILKARKAILEVSVGGTLEVLATDPGSREDFRVFSQTTGHALVSEREEKGEFVFVVRRTR
ncbi:MAG: sulfurtransferase TusA family protein [Hyphomicrobium sp.]|jgi:tRNA 2-thiouridine synthesizing protein A|nr:sulfurtransferase TusA family protein [Hyphomicrobium sp.]